MPPKPQVGESANQLLKKLVEISALMAAPSVQDFQDAPQDGKQYARVNGQWQLVPEPVIDGVVQSYTQLPVTLNSPKIDDVYLCLEADGVYFVNRHPAGLYARKTNLGQLADWKYAGDLTDSED